MHTGFLHLHNFLRWLVLFAAVAAVVMYALGYFNKKTFSKADDKIGLAFMALMDTQLLIGLVLYFMGPYLTALMDNAGEVMKNSAARFFAIEHGFGMIVALILVHIGRAASKKGDDTSRFRKGFIYFGIALLIMLITIPWAFRGNGVARPWFPGVPL